MGFRSGMSLSRVSRDQPRIFSRYPETKRIFLRDGKFYETGETFRQPELASTLDRLIKSGPNEFYQGRTAELIAESMKKYGWITMEDLKNYRAIEREPLKGMYRGHEIITMPPPSSGGIALIEMLNILEHFNLKELGLRVFGIDASQDRSDASRFCRSRSVSWRRRFCESAGRRFDLAQVRRPVGRND